MQVGAEVGVGADRDGDVGAHVDVGCGWILSVGGMLEGVLHASIYGTGSNQKHRAADSRKSQC